MHGPPFSTTSPLARSVIALSLLALCSSLQHPGIVRRGICTINKSSGSRLSTSRLFFADHLTDCTQNPLIAEIYGSAGDICLSTGLSNVGLFNGFLDQVLNIGFLVIAYFLFKRGSIYSLVDFLSSDEDEGSGVLDIDDNDSFDRGSKQRRNVCPQCNGTGTFRANLRVDDGEGNAVTCDVCLGSGTIEAVARGRSSGNRILPRSVGDKEDR